jgi:hypothetical protein
MIRGALFLHRSTVDCAGISSAGDLLQAFFTVRSERQLMEQINYYLLFRWFLSIDDCVWEASTFSKNQHQLLERK